MRRNGLRLNAGFVRHLLVAATSFAVLSAGAIDVAPQVVAAEMDKKAEPPNPAQIAIEEYETRVKAGEADKVIEECTAAITADPKKAFVAHVGRGIALNSKKDYENAIKDFDKATGVEGRDAASIAIRCEGFTHRSEALFEQGKFIDAVDSAYFALLEINTSAKAMARRAMAYNGWDKADKAIYFANRALAIDDQQADALSARAVAYGIKKDFTRSIEDQTKAIDLDGKNAKYLERRAVAYIGKKEFENAAKDITEALKLDPDCSDAYCDRAMMYAMVGKMGEAISELDTAISKNPSSFRAHFQKALVEQFRKNYDAAIASVSKAIEVNGTYVPALNLRGSLYNDKKNYEKAVEDFTAAIAIDRKSVDAYSGRGNAYKRLNKTELAKADLDKVKEIQPPPAPKSNAKKTNNDNFPALELNSATVDAKRRPQVKEAAQKIDQFVAANYEKYKVQPNPMTSDSQFVRRIYLDITGQIPSYQQTLKFLGSKDPEKRANLIDELLSSDGYASHSYNYWADVLRLIDRVSEDVRGEPYRQWIKQSLAENKPWDKLVYELITAEGLIWDNPATGYMQRDANMPLDNMNNTVRIFLGTRIGCAQCHNHPFDRWTQKEFYQMAAFTFGTSVRVGGGDKRYWEKNPNDRLQEEYHEIVQEEEDRRNNSYVFDQILRENMRIVNTQTNKEIKLPKDYAYEDAKPDSVVKPQTLFGSKASIKPGETPRQAFARWLTEKQNPRFAKTIANRIWQQTFGIGQIEPADDMTDHTVAENPALMDFLEQQMKDLDFNMKEYQRILFNTETYQRQACFDETPVGAPYHFPGPALRRMTAEQVWDSFLVLASENAEDYREMPYKLKTDVTGYDLSTVSAAELLDSRAKQRAVDQKLYKHQEKFKYKGVLLVRASELPAPLPANHFIRVFGQSDRELISSSSTAGSVPQVLFMFNGPISHMLLEKDSTIYNIVMKKKTVTEGVKAVFLTILNREPDSEDLALATQEIKTNGPAGYGNVIWSLVNTREFLFIQ